MWCFVNLIGVFHLTQEFLFKWRNHHYWWRPQNLTYTQHSLPLSSEGTCHIYCDTRLPFQWFFPRASVTHTCCRVFGSGAVTTCFIDLNLSRQGIEHRSLACEANPLPQSHCVGKCETVTLIIWIVKIHQCNPFIERPEKG